MTKVANAGKLFPKAAQTSSLAACERNVDPTKPLSRSRIRSRTNRFDPDNVEPLSEDLRARLKKLKTEVKEEDGKWRVRQGSGKGNKTDPVVFHD